MYSSSSPPTCIMTSRNENTYKVYLIKLTLLLLLCLYSGLNLETDRAYDSRHEHRSSCVGDAASCRRWGVLVVSQGATEQAQVVEGQDQDHHAAKSDTANPPVSSR